MTIPELIAKIAEILDSVKGMGLIGVLVAVILLFIQDPDRAIKIQSIVTKIIFYLFKVGSKQYLSSTINNSVSTFFKNDISKYIPSSLKFRLKIKWVSSPLDPILTKDGTVIIRLHESYDQTKNILNATQIILPHVVCPNIRNNIKKDMNETIDLVLLRKMSKNLGNHAYLTFQKHFLRPELDSGHISKALFHDLVAVDNHGIFVPIFLEELSNLGIKLSDTEDLSDKTESIGDFLAYLLDIAKRARNEEVALDYISHDFSVCIILMAKSWKADAQGVTPYTNRIKKDIRMGAESIYLIAYKSAFDFLKRVLDVVESDMEVITSGVNKIRIKNENSGNQQIAISRISRNSNVTEDIFKKRIIERGFKEGDIVDGNVLDVSKERVVVDVSGVNAILTYDEASWFTVTDCSAVLEKETTHRFIIKSLDHSTGEIILSLRLPESDPWLSPYFPKLNDEIEVEIVGQLSDCMISRYHESVEIEIPNKEASWNYADLNSSSSMVGKIFPIVITSIDDDTRKIYGSIKQLIDDPWDQIYKDLPKGTELRVAVDNILHGEVIVDIADDLKGVIPREAMMKAGHEYADFSETLVKGQKIDVVVSKINRSKQRITLNLKRNI